jgi:hypothetical protein
MQHRKHSFALSIVKGAAMMIVLLSALGAFAQTAGTLSVLWNFGAVSNFDANSPICNGMVFDTKGNLYGATDWGGADGAGVVFELTPPTQAGGSWTENLLYSFDPQSTTTKDGSFPCGNLAIDAAGNLYGTTLWGGTNNTGTVWELSPPTGGSTSWTETILHSFGAAGSGDGFSPFAGVTLASSAATTLYGTTLCGGTGSAAGAYGYLEGFGLNGCSNGSGTVYQLSYKKPTKKAKGGWTETILYSFAATSSTDGALPMGALALKGKDLYGVTTEGGIDASNGAAFCSVASGNGTYGCGIAYELQPGTKGWTETVLYNFGATATDAANPLQMTPVIVGNNIYGTTVGGGTDSGSGTFWELVYSSGTQSYSEQVLYSFAGAPNWQLVEGKNANTWYGAAASGEYTVGSLVELAYVKPTKKVTGGWTETTLYQFTAGSDGGIPNYNELIKDKSGNLYGMNNLGGGDQFIGNVFEFQP